MMRSQASQATSWCGCASRSNRPAGQQLRFRVERNEQNDGEFVMAEIALHSATDVNDLLNSFAVVAHMDQGWQYENAVKTVEVLKDLGITHIREGFAGLGH